MCSTCYRDPINIASLSLPLPQCFSVTDQSVSSFLTPSGRKLWKERAKKKWLVLVDDQEDSESTSPIMALWDALMKVHAMHVHVH